MAGFGIIPSLRQAQPAAVDPNAPIAGTGGGIQPIAPPVNQVAPPSQTMPTLTPVNTMAPQHIGAGGRFLSGALGMFAPGVAQFVPGTEQHQRAMQAQGLELRPPSQQRSTGSRVASAVLGAFGGER